MVKYFFDSYAVIEMIKGNPRYAKFINEEAAFTIFNLAEIYWSVLNEFGEENAEKVYEAYKEGVVEITGEIVKEAMKFRKKYKKRNLSYADCMGYVYAFKNNLVFLTGDKEFEGLESVEFIK
jgi:hypothetical protein